MKMLRFQATNDDTATSSMYPSKQQVDNREVSKCKLSNFMNALKKHTSRPQNLQRDSSFYTQGSTASTAATEISEFTESSDIIEIRPVESNDTTTNSTTRRRSSSIRFAAQDEIRYTISRHEYTDDELVASWFQEDEYDQITRNCCKQVRKLQRGQVLKDKKYCARGLEAHTRLAAMEKAYNRKLAFDVVLDEQDEQWHLGISDETCIAERYMEISASCHMWASVVGLQDQREAEACAD